ncbi:EcsC family protein [Bifidobacterium simiarum]|uniref:EcsC family protein n=1 Tax=Bifidobacterium simiarum TaxID=2045441 RepID=UPI001BDC4122|nr:EcsC family protein [Bifidobacterium simiarum]MBT1165435.1 EcsC family protein [Bifidobacterium simiarum]
MSVIDNVGNTAKSMADGVGKAASGAAASAANTANKVKETVQNIGSTVLTQEQMSEILDKCYDAALNGIPKVSKSSDDMAQEYLDRYGSPEKAAKRFIANQIAKCSTSGFVTGFGGLLTLPVSIPANISSVIYVQMRMVAALAYMGGYDTHEDEVQTLAYLCLVGTSVTDTVKKTGIEVANKVTMGMLKKLPGSVLTSINKKVGFRMLTKFGTTGTVNLVKVVPVAGALVGAGMDFAGTKVIADRAYNAFILKQID